MILIRSRVRSWDVEARQRFVDDRKNTIGDMETIRITRYGYYTKYKVSLVLLHKIIAVYYISLFDRFVLFHVRNAASPRRGTRRVEDKRKEASRRNESYRKNCFRFRALGRDVKVTIHQGQAASSLVLSRGMVPLPKTMRANANWISSGSLGSLCRIIVTTSGWQLSCERWLAWRRWLDDVE